MLGKFPIWILVIAMVVLTFSVSGYLMRGRSESPTGIAIPPAPTPAQTLAPTPITPPVATNKPAPSGVIEITAENLVKEFLANPNKYKRGTVFQVSGVLDWHRKFVEADQSTDFFLGPAVDNNLGGVGLGIGVVIHVESRTEMKLLRAFWDINDGDQVVVRGTYYFFSARSQGVTLEDASLISVTPAR